MTISARDLVTPKRAILLDRAIAILAPGMFPAGERHRYPHKIRLLKVAEMLERVRLSRAVAAKQPVAPEPVISPELRMAMKPRAAAELILPVVAELVGKSYPRAIVRGLTLSGLVALVEDLVDQALARQ